MIGQDDHLPIAIIGAGPIGLAAAAHLVDRGLRPLVLEAGDEIAASIRDWAHVRLFSSWRHNIDAASRGLLARAGWTDPHPDDHPTGGELIARYLEPLAATPELRDTIRLAHHVTGVARSGTDKVRTGGRHAHPFVVAVDTADGPRRLTARAVIDASGTWSTPNPIGGDGLPARGETEHADHISHGVPDVLGVERSRFAGRRIAVVGAGHSAQNVVRDLAAVAPDDPETEVTWLVRRADAGEMFGGGVDPLPARTALGTAARRLVDTGLVRLVTGFRTAAVEADGDALVLVGDDGRSAGPFDEIVAATGFRPDLSLLRELRLRLDPVLESTEALAPLIDPNLHSCWSVPPHGAAELDHPEADVYVVGMKSYGRAPTFLLATGYEQVRSVVAELAGDRHAAVRVERELATIGVGDGGRGGAGEAHACCG